MGAMLNGMAAHGGLRVYGATFFVFSDYLRPAIRLAALQRLPVVYVFTHDSIGLGEDGPTHQPIEHLMSLRAMPQLRLIRPADANETVAAWRIPLESDAPPALVLHRRDDRMVTLALGRYLADHLSHASLVELPGEDHLFFVGDTDALLDETELFLTGAKPPQSRDRLVTTILFTDVVGSTARAAELGDRLARLIEGRIVQEAAPRELFTRPASTVVARFFGANTILRGMVTAGRLEVADTALPVAAPDGPATAIIRPEHLHLSADGPLRGRCAAASFQGTHLRLRVDCGGATIEAHVDPDAVVEVGDQVALGVAARHVWVLPGPADPPWGASARPQRDSREPSAKSR